MSSIYHNLHTACQYKAATGLNLQEFEALFTIFEPLYTPKTGTEYTTPVLTNKREALFFILHYYKSYPTLQNMGLYFGFSDFTASTYLTLLKPILKTALQQVTYLKKFIFKDQESFDKAFEGVEEIYIDVTEITVKRPQNEVL
jgi:hypothetical protein